MMYTSVCAWRDLEDGHLYSAGEAYPHDGRAIKPGRIAELAGAENKAHRAVIQAVPSEGEETPAPERKTNKRAAKTRKTAQ